MDPKLISEADLGRIYTIPQVRVLDYKAAYDYEDLKNEQFWKFVADAKRKMKAPKKKIKAGEKVCIITLRLSTTTPVKNSMLIDLTTLERTNDSANLFSHLTNRQSIYHFFKRAFLR